MTDEEVHAITALLRRNETIAVLNLQGNLITDEGCRSLSSILSGPSSLENIDLRRNRISKTGIKHIVEALERSDRVRHVHVHAGGKIEAMGGTDPSNCHNKSSTVCVVDVRDNSKPEESVAMKEELFGLPITFQESEELSKKITTKSNPIGKSKPTDAVSEDLAEDALESMLSEVGTHENFPHSSTPTPQDQERRKKNLQTTRAKEEKQSRENGWVGRAGGLQVTNSKSNNSINRKKNNKQKSANDIGGNNKGTDNKSISISPFS